MHCIGLFPAEQIEERGVSFVSRRLHDNVVAPAVQALRELTTATLDRTKYLREVERARVPFDTECPYLSVVAVRVIRCVEWLPCAGKRVKTERHLKANASSGVALARGKLD